MQYTSHSAAYLTPLLLKGETQGETVTYGNSIMVGGVLNILHKVHFLIPASKHRDYLTTRNSKEYLLIYWVDSEVYVLGVF